MGTKFADGGERGRKPVLQEITMKRMELTGMRFGSMVVIKKEASATGDSAWLVKCDCGNETVKTTRQLRKAMSCGRACPIWKAALLKRISTHGMTGQPAYLTWLSMRNRCYKQGHINFNNYGGRGISVCEEWRNSFEAFWADMGPTWEPGLELDRIDNDGNYEPTNCRWTTPKGNAQNRRSTTTPSWVFAKMAEHGVNTPAYFARLYRGWTMEDACSIPIKPKRKYRLLPKT